MYTKVGVKRTLTRDPPPSQKSSLPTDMYAPDVYMTPSTLCSAVPRETGLYFDCVFHAWAILICWWGGVKRTFPITFNSY